MTTVANPNDTVQFEGSNWRVETRVGGVYQLRQFNKDGLGLSSELRLAQRAQFTVKSSGNSGSDTATPELKVPLAKAFPKAPHYLTRKRERVGNAEAFAPDDVMSADADAYDTGDAAYRANSAGAQIRRALRAGVDIDASE